MFKVSGPILMELFITIKKVLAVQLGDAASTLQVPPAYTT